jgi:hypothetical protein
MNSAPSAYLSYAHAAAKLDLSVNALKQRVKRKTIPSWTYTYQLGSIRFIASALDEWMQPAERAQVLGEVHARRVEECRGPRHLNVVARVK